jgi:hypothetical protein
MARHSETPRGSTITVVGWKPIGEWGRISLRSRPTITMGGWKRASAATGRSPVGPGSDGNTAGWRVKSLSPADLVRRTPYGGEARPFGERNPEPLAEKPEHVVRERPLLVRRAAGDVERPRQGESLGFVP